MENTDLNGIKTGLETLAVFRTLLSDRVLCALYEYLKAPDVGKYADFVSKLYEANGGNLGEYIKDICENSETFYVRAKVSGRPLTDYIEQCMKNELETLQRAAELNVETLRKPLEWQGFLPGFYSGGVDITAAFSHRIENIQKYGYGLYAKNPMFYIDADTSIVPVKNPDKIRLCELVDYEIQRRMIIDNTKALLAGKPAANILLTGDAGTGKSSTVKAVANEFFDEGLRIIEVRKDQLHTIMKILDELADNPLKFILFIDDLSFLSDDDNFNALKAILEGCVSAKSKNVVIYATSNRRHIIKETFSDREGDDIHRNDTIQELISLSERFGLHITFSKPDKKTYLRIVKHLAKEKDIKISAEELEAKAERMALERGGRSARIARQFIDSMMV